MKHNIKAIQNHHLSCHQLLLATYASYQNRSSEMICADGWGFIYERNYNIFGESLYPGYQNRRAILFKKFHGIQLHEKIYTSHEILVEELQSNLPCSPLILRCDVFDCPWNISYHKYSIPHCVLIIGIEENAEQLYILDPYSTINTNMINMSAIAPNNGYFATFTTLPFVEPKIEDYHAEIINSLNYIVNSKLFDNLDSFYSDLHNRFEEVIQQKYTDIYAIPLILKLNQIANQRYSYCTFLNILHENKLVDLSLLELMNSIADEYSLYRKLLIKQIMRRKVEYDQVEKFYTIIKKEHDAYELMKSFA